MSFKRRLVVLLVLAVSVFSFGLESQEDKDYAYTIGPKDLLTINVFEVPELNITVRVSEDGAIVLPLLGVVKVAGLSRARAEEQLAALLEKSYLKNAQVTIFIKEYQSQRVSVIGAVQKPGNYELIGKQTLLQLISLAGGLTGEAADRIIVIRQYKDGKSASLTIDLNELLMKGEARLNIPLQAGDIVNVPEERTIDVYVFGQVKNPGNIKVKTGSQVTILKVIAQAGGFSERARRGAVLVTRLVKDKETKIKVNVKKIIRGKQPDFEILPGDVVFVPESIL
jgi:polysaccharide export outer membrane protein